MTEKSPYIINTSDGSHSIYVPALNETYHSSHGAITESRHVFIRAGLDEYLQKHRAEKINIFEIGFGTGLNALLALQWSNEKSVKLNYHSIEQFPVPEEVYQKLNFGKLLEDEEKFSKIHSAEWDTEVGITEKFLLKKINFSWKNYELPEDYYHVVFYDAFAPGKQPEMWVADLLRKCYMGLTNSGILVTYCARGQFKRDMSSCGFEVETLPGPPGKKEMVRGVRKKSEI